MYDCKRIHQEIAPEEKESFLKLHEKISAWRILFYKFWYLQIKFD